MHLFLALLCGRGFDPTEDTERIIPVIMFGMHKRAAEASIRLRILKDCWLEFADLYR